MLFTALKEIKVKILASFISIITRRDKNTRTQPDLSKAGKKPCDVYELDYTTIQPHYFGIGREYVIQAVFPSLTHSGKPQLEKVSAAAAARSAEAQQMCAVEKY